MVEVIAIQRAVQNVRADDLGDVNIISDLKSAFMVLSAAEEARETISNIKQDIKEYKGKITLTWIRTHMGNFGNERADQAGAIHFWAITFAVDEINRLHSLVDRHQWNFTVAETYGEEEESILQVSFLWTQGIAGYIGPQETCIHEAKMASGFNFPTISYCPRESPLTSKGLRVLCSSSGRTPQTLRRSTRHVPINT
ncbi:hypothetical protein AVEN_146289-1 [Araneus ventricosus]|uniref:Uncharacterized protein n=1 Tax=Araneus ventricosus TaxID=182803 RepID=A0A4Y2HMM5_ARAVE|nr:hypothetical protein AVEN_146289-1 [Araneus ventricosus]